MSSPLHAVNHALNISPGGDQDVSMDDYRKGRNQINPVAGPGGFRVDSALER
jgi:hypothetical protein